MKPKSRMYEVDGKRVRTWNPFAGCKYNCVYCYSPAIYKRFSKCEKCQNFIPHFHKERLKQKFKAGETWFVCSMGDISFASFDQFADILEVISHYPKTTFYIQSKNPAYFADYFDPSLPPSLNNVVLGTTIESNYTHFYSFITQKANGFSRWMNAMAIFDISKHLYILNIYLLICLADIATKTHVSI